MSYDAWKTFLLSEVCEIGSSKRIYRDEYTERGIPFYRSKEIIQRSRNDSVEDPLFISKERFNELVKKFGAPVENDILITSVGTLGVAYYVKAKDLFYFKDGNLTWLKKFKSNVFSKYIYYWITSPIGQRAIDDISIGSTQKAITIKGLSSLKVNLPNLEKQKAIANILSSLDDKIELNNQMNESIEELAQTLYKQWFVDFEFPNENGEPYKSSGGKMVESELGLIPDGWEASFLGKSKITKLLSSGIDKFESQKSYIATADVSDTNISSFETKITIDDRPSRANMQPKENTVWFAKMKDSRKLIRVSTKSRNLIKECIFSTGFAGIECDNSLNYIWSYLLTKEFDETKNNLSNGTTMQAINNSNINRIKIVVPSENMLSKYEKLTESIFTQVELNNIENRVLAETRDLLLPKLMSGEIRVPIKE